MILSLDADRWIAVGRLGRLRFLKGFYAYVGSAFGPGGLAARLRHHLKAKTRRHWHIDRLGQHAKIVEIWYAERRRHEHLWAEGLAGIAPTAAPVVGFGCSDCGCRSHLIYFPKRPHVWQLNRFLAARRGASYKAKILAPRRLRAPDPHNLRIFFSRADNNNE